MLDPNPNKFLLVLRKSISIKQFLIAYLFLELDWIRFILYLVGTEEWDNQNRNNENDKNTS